MHPARSGALGATAGVAAHPEGPRCASRPFSSDPSRWRGCSPREQAASENVITLRLGSQDVAEAKGVLTDLLFAEPLLVMDWHGRPGSVVGDRLAGVAGGRPRLEGGTPIGREVPRRQPHDRGQRRGNPAAAGQGRSAPVIPIRHGDRHARRAHPGAPAQPRRRVPSRRLWPAPPSSTTARRTSAPGPSGSCRGHPSSRPQRNGGYYRGTPGIDRVQIITYDTQRAAWAAMMRGEVDMVQEVNREAVEFLEGSSRFEMYSSIRPFYIPLVFNLRHPILRHVEVRRALNEAIDRDEIVNEVMRGRGQVADDPIWPSHWAYNPAARKHSYNPQAARVRLDAAGFPVRRPTESGDGQPLSVQVPVLQQGFPVRADRDDAAAAAGGRGRRARPRRRRHEGHH